MRKATRFVLRRFLRWSAGKKGDARIVYVRNMVPDVAATRGWGCRLRSLGEPSPLWLGPAPDGCGFERAYATKNVIAEKRETKSSPTVLNAKRVHYFS